MSEHLLHIDFTRGRGLQEQIREHLTTMIHQNHFGDRALPSCRKMAEMLKVSRNTIVLVYEKLVDEGFLISRERSGYFVNLDYLSQNTQLVSRTFSLNPSVSDSCSSSISWKDRLVRDLSSYQNIRKPSDWQDYPYPFIFGQPDHSLFPLNQWREFSRLAQRQSAMKAWVSDFMDNDDEFLVDQLKQHVLSKRGIQVSRDEILVTVGTQNSLYLLASLLAGKGTRLGMEDPGYPDARNIFTHHGAEVVPLGMDDQGVMPDSQMDTCDYLYLTPSHQVPTNVTMSMERRQALLSQASKKDFIIIEDDYESETNLQAQPHPALKSLDQSGRVIYVGSLSKSLSPGLRIGFLVADAELIQQARMLRRLMYRHPPMNNQRTAALFISMGYYDSYLRKLRKSYGEKWQVMSEALERYLSGSIINHTSGGCSFWLRLPDAIDLDSPVFRCATEGIIIEPGDVHFLSSKSPGNFIRLGFSAIAPEAITPGIQILAQVISAQAYPLDCPSRLPVAV